MISNMQKNWNVSMKYWLNCSTALLRLAGLLVAVDLKMHTAIKMFARRRGWSIREAVHNLLAVGFETVIKNEYRKAHQSDKTIRGIPGKSR